MITESRGVRACRGPGRVVGLAGDTGTITAMTAQGAPTRFRWVEAARRQARRIRRGVMERLLARLSYERLPAKAAVRIAYEVVLRRPADPAGLADYAGAINSGQRSRLEVVQALQGSEEFRHNARFTGPMFGHSLHSSRCQFIRSRPRAERILDIGGTHLHSDAGALVAMGYPYPFEELVVVDLPAENRHAIYRSSGARTEVESPLGAVRYRYHSMTDLSDYSDAVFSLVYAGQSIEHVTRDDGRSVANEVYRVLRPGGRFALDTPNGRVTRLQQEKFIDPDHKVEYELDELVQLLTATGFVVEETKGLNYAGRSLAAGKFDADEVAGNNGMFADAVGCYVLCIVARKPV